MSQSAQVYSDTRPLNANGAQTPLFKNMQDYANKAEVQDLLQKLCSDLFTERPENALDYIARWAEKEKRQRTMAHNVQH